MEPQYLELANRIGLGQSERIPKLFQLIADLKEAKLLLALPGDAPSVAAYLGK
ncbi:MAG: 4Fe-4S ferredoxin, partial [Desulfomonile tiedjei]|nr:4Fe-4S ferredoxin [Desulfomonile tiedjei]